MRAAECDPSAGWRPLPDDGRGASPVVNLLRLAAACLLYLAVFGPCALAVALGADATRMVTGPMRRGARLMLALLGVRLAVTGGERLAGRGAALLLANHGSLLDVFIFGVLCERPTVFVMKKELARLPLLGYVLVRAGHIFIDRARPTRAMRDLLGGARAALGGGRALLIFPEGTRHPHGTLGPFQPGAFQIAMRARVPVVPVTVLNAAALLPRRLWASRPGVLEVVVGEPIDTTRWSAADLALHVAEVRRAIAGPLARYRERFHERTETHDAGA